MADTWVGKLIDSHADAVEQLRKDLEEAKQGSAADSQDRVS